MDDCADFKIEAEQRIQWLRRSCRRTHGTRCRTEPFAKSNRRISTAIAWKASQKQRRHGKSKFRIASSWWWRTTDHCTNWWSKIFFVPYFQWSHPWGAIVKREHLYAWKIGHRRKKNFWHNPIPKKKLPAWQMIVAKRTRCFTIAENYQSTLEKAASLKATRATLESQLSQDQNRFKLGQGAYGIPSTTNRTKSARNKKLQHLLMA